MTGVKKAIADNIPESWEKVLRKNRCYCSFIDQFYEAIAAKKNRNKYYFRITITNAKHYMRIYSIATLAQTFNFHEGIKFWNNIQTQISNYEFNCK